MKGSHPDVSNHLFNLFSIDKTAMYFITDEKWTEKEMHGKNISDRGSITGKVSLCSFSSTMKINFYSKEKVCGNNNNSSTLSKEIKEAFKTKGKLQGMNDFDRKKT